MLLPGAQRCHILSIFSHTRNATCWLAPLVHETFHGQGSGWGIGGPQFYTLRGTDACNCAGATCGGSRDPGCKSDDRWALCEGHAFQKPRHFCIYEEHLQLWRVQRLGVRRQLCISQRQNVRSQSHPSTSLPPRPALSRMQVLCLFLSSRARYISIKIPTHGPHGHSFQKIQLDINE